MRQGSEPIPGYRLDRLLGRGGFGEVWRARGPGQTSVALKFLNLAGKPGRRELRAVQRVKEIRHAHLLPIHGLWILDSAGRLLEDSEFPLEAVAEVQTGEPGSDTEHEGQAATLIIAMTLADGSLFDRLRIHQRAGRTGIPRFELLPYAEDAARAIDFLNSPRHDLGNGLVCLQHCDIKPQNILLLGDCACVADFGLLKLLDESAAHTSLNGTPAYIAPERIQRLGVSTTGDQYSLAITLYQLLTGQLPFDADSYLDIFQAHLEHRLDFVGVSHGEAEILHTATAVDPRRRFASAAELVSRLRAIWQLPDARHVVAPSDPVANHHPHSWQRGVAVDRYVPTVELGESSPGTRHDGSDELLVQMRNLGADQFRVTLSTRRGDAEPMLESNHDHPLSPRLLANLREQLLGLLSSDTAITLETLAPFARYAFRVGLPEAVQQRLRLHRGGISVTESPADVPWELLHDGHAFLARRQSLVRQTVDTLANRSPREARCARVLLVTPEHANDGPLARAVHALRDVFDRHHLACEFARADRSALLVHTTDRIATGDFDICHVHARDGVDAGTGEYLIQLDDQSSLSTEELLCSLRGEIVLSFNVSPQRAWCSADEMVRLVAARQVAAQRLLAGTALGRASSVILPTWHGGNPALDRFFPELYAQFLGGMPLGTAAVLARSRLSAAADDLRLALGVTVFGTAELTYSRWQGPPPLEAPCNPPNQNAGPVHGLLRILLRGTRYEQADATATSLRLALLAAISSRKASRSSVLDMGHLWIGLLRVPRGTLAELVQAAGKQVSELQGQLEAVSSDAAADDREPAHVPATRPVREAFARAARLADERAEAVLTDVLLLEAMLAVACPATALVRTFMTR